MIAKSKRDDIVEIVPDFMIELKSKTDSFSRLQQKMIEYRRNGVKLGWLIHPGKRKVLVYGGPEREVLELDNPDSVTGHGPVAGFVLHLNPVWEGLDALN